MKILQINKFYHILGGTDKYFFKVSKFLRSKGNQVAFFCMEDKKNIKTKWKMYFVSNIPLENRSLIEDFKLFCRSIYSIEAQWKISKLLDDFRPDIVHLHDFYHYLSPSILIEFKKRNIPVVMTVHDYHLISPNRNMYHDGKICEICKPDKYYKSVAHKCVRNSLLLGIVESIEKYIWEIIGWDNKYIDLYITPSIFIRKKLIEYGLDRSKIIHLSHYIESNTYNTGANHCDYILYFGRLSQEKGLDCLIKAMKLLPKIKLIIVGKGSEEYSLRVKVKRNKLENVEFVGFKEGFELKRLLIKSRFTILPSVWYEVAPLSILESLACGKPVIASKIGGIPELVKDGFNGFLVDSGNVEDLVEKIDRLWNNPVLCRKLGKNARDYVEKNFGKKQHYNNLKKIYKIAIKKHEI